MIKKVENNYLPSMLREDIEWLNFWWARANKNSIRRYLLIGDSISRRYRDALEKELDMPVDYLGTSSLLLDELFLKEIEGFFNWGGVDLYSAIQVQIGYHGINEIGIETDKKFYALYKEQYSNLIKYLLKKTKKLVLASTTPVIHNYHSFSNRYLKYIIGNLHPLFMEHVNEHVDRELIVRNQIVQDLAQDFDLTFNDLYLYMKNEGKKYRHVDDVHYEHKSDVFIAKKVAYYMMNN